MESFHVRFSFYQYRSDLRHNDFPLTIRDIYQNDFTDLNFDSNLTENPLFAGYAMSHTDLPKLRIGKVGGQVIINYQIQVLNEVNFKLTEIIYLIANTRHSFGQHTWDVTHNSKMQ